MPKAGSQIAFCDLPIRFDTYKGCSHGCKYCFAARKYDISKIENGEGVKALREFIVGNRTDSTHWCDWNIPLHWGGMSDPFQPIEQERQTSLACLRLLAETHYPFVVSTKGTSILASAEYLEALSACNAVVQVSLVAPEFDTLEPGAPTFEQRLADIAAIAPKCRRLIVRIQPYVREVKRQILANLPRYKAAGVYGVTIEGIKYIAKRTGMVKLAGDYVYPVDKLKPDYVQIKERCHQLGLAFFCAENRLRNMGDDLCCCGIAGLSDFTGNRANVAHMLAGEKVEFTPRMQQQGLSNQVFKALAQDSVSTQFFRQHSFAEIMELLSRDKGVLQILGR